MSETIQETKIDRTGWPSGEWDSEPDRVDFIHAGFSCLLHRNEMGAWCGYVGVTETHPAFGKDYDAVDVEAHGGLTYARACRGSICHVPQPGMADKVWWLGFDLIHSGDTAPGMLRFHRASGFIDETYRNLPYARRQTERLAKQLRKMEPVSERRLTGQMQTKGVAANLKEKPEGKQ